MSVTIDEKVVEMRFDGRDFERNAQSSISTLDKLKQSLNLDGAAKGFENVGAAANKLSFSGLTDAADAVAVKFSYMQMAIANQFNKIVDSAVSAGKRVVSAFTTEPIKMGFQEYETQINSVQTILANTSSKGTTLDQVNEALDTLNAYADKTIYNFTEMTRNIGTFTAAGIELDTATSAIQGIANLAAVSGSTSQQASTAMYQLSQALAAGTVKLMDWNSVVNAGMGGQVFQDALKETSRLMAQQAKDLKRMSVAQREAWQESHGYTDEQMKTMMSYSANVDNLIKKHGSFRESLQAGWITADVLTMTLNKMTKTGVVDYVMDMTGATRESIVELQKLGDTYGYDSEQAKELANSIANGDEAMAKSVLETIKMATTAEDAATKVKTFTQLMDTLKEAAQSGWTQTWEMLIGDFEEAKELWTAVSDYFGKAIGDSAEARNNLVKAWIDMGGRTQVLDSIKNAFSGLLNIINPIKEAFREIFPPTTAEQVFKVSSELEKLTGQFRDFTTKHSGNIKKAFTGIFSAMDVGVTFIKSLGRGVLDLAKNFTGLSGGLLENAARFGEWLTGLRDTVKETDIFGVAVEKITSVIQNVIDKFKSFVSVIAAKIHFPSLEDLGNLLSSIWTFVKDIASGIGGVLSDIGTKIGEFMSNTDMASVMKVLNGSLLAGVFVKLSGLVENGSGILGNLKETLVGIKDLVLGMNEKKSGGGLIDALKDGLASLQEAVSVNKIIKIAVAVGILAGSLKVISTIDSEKISSALFGLAGVFTELVVALAVFDKFDLTGSDKGLGSLMGLAVSVLILSSALKNLGDLDWGQIGRGLTAMGGVLLELVGFTKLMGNGTVGTGSMVGLIVLALSLKVFASAMSDFSTFNWDQIKTSLGAMGGVLIELGVFSRLVAGNKNMLTIGIGLIEIAAAMKIFASAMSDFAAFDGDQIKSSLTAMGGALAEVAIATRIMPSNMIGIGTGLLIVSGALHIMAAALEKFGNLTGEQIVKGLVSIGVLLAELAIALNFMQGTLGGSAALLVAAAALAVLVIPIEALSKIAWTSLAKSIIAIAGALAVIGVAGAAFGAAAPAILLGSVALAAMGAAMLLLVPSLAALGAMKLGDIIKSILSMAAAFVVLGAIAAVLGIVSPLILAFGGAIVAVGAGVALFGAGLTSIGVGLSMIGGALEVFVTAVGNSAEALSGNLAAIIEVIIQTISSVVDGIITLVPKFIEAGITILMSFLKGIHDNIHQIVTSVGEIITEFLDALATQLPAIVESGMNLIVEFINGLSTSLAEHGPEFATALWNLFVSAIDTLLAFLTGGAVTDIKDAAVKIMNSGFIQGLKDKVNGIKETFVNGVNNAKNAIVNKISEWISAGKSTLEGFVQGLKDKANGIKETFVNGVNNAKNAIVNKISEWISTGRNVINGLISGISEKVSGIRDTFVNGVNNAKNAITNKVSEWVSAGGNLISGVISGIKDKVYSLTGSVNELINKAKSAISEKVASWVETGKNLVDGLISGIGQKAQALVDKAKGVVNNAIRAAKNLLGIKSPSRVFMEIGRYVDEGFIIGMESYAGRVADATEDLGRSAINSMSNTVKNISDAINDNIDAQPTIRPVLDLTNVESGAGRLNSMLSRTRAMTISASMNRRIDSEIQNGTASTGNTYQFTQNNYSPKALSSIEIYRQTKNQFSTLERMATV